MTNLLDNENPLLVTSQTGFDRFVTVDKDIRQQQPLQTLPRRGNKHQELDR